MKYSSFFKAAAGVALAAMVLSCGPKKLSDKEILTLIYNSTGGAEWSEYNQDGWLVEEDLADWHGVKVNEEGRVIELSLSEAQGPIPAEIGGLTELESIYLNVELSDEEKENPSALPVPLSLSKLEKLRSLDIRCTDAHCEVPSLENMPFLEELRLSFRGAAYPVVTSTGLTQLYLNGFDGPITEWVYAQGNLKELSINPDKLEGGISPDIRNLSCLERLNVDYSLFIGSVDVPDSELPAAEIFENLKNLKYVFLRGCSTSGVLPESIGDMPELKSLILCDLGLTGELPKELGNLPKIETLEIYSQEITGEIPAELFNAVSLKQLWLQRNHLSGPLPKEIGNLVNLESLYIAKNELSGKIPAELAKCTKLGKGVFTDFSDNQFSEDIPEQVKSMEYFSKFKF